MRFDNIRSWDGSQARAFEEICYQLLRSEAPEGSTVVRAGNPDGGVEWYARLKGGSEWGWQAKFIPNLDHLLPAMGQSVRRVSIERPKLVKLIFVISTNLSTGTSGGQRKSGRQRYEQSVSSWRGSIDGADRIEFELIQESDLLERLTKPIHRGRAWFWWSKPQFGPAWLEEKLNEQAAIAGPRYQPDLQVDLLIEEDLGALSRSGTELDQLQGLCREVIHGGHDPELNESVSGELKKHYDDVVQSTSMLIEICSETSFHAGMSAGGLDAIKASVAGFQSSVRAAETLEKELTEDRRDHETGSTSSKPPRGVRGYGWRELRKSVERLDKWLDS